MKKRLVMALLVALIITLVSPLSNALADHEQGWLYGNTSQGYDAIFDGDHSTYYEITNGNSIIVDFPTSLETTQFFINYNASGGGVRLDFYNDLDESLKMSFLPSTRNDFSTLEIVDVSKVKITANSADALLYEFDVYGSEYTGPDLTAPNEVSNLDVIATDSEITLSYDLPIDDDFSHVNIYQDGVLIAGNITTTSYTVEGLTNDVEYDFRVTTVDELGNESLGASLLATPQDTTAPDEISNLIVDATDTTITVNFDNPTDSDFSHVNVYLNGALKGSTELGTYELSNLMPGTTFTLKLESVDERGNKSAGIERTATTKPPVGEIGKLSSETTYNNVNFFWENPESTYFDHVNIYRKQIEIESFFERLFSSRTVSAAEISDEYTLMYETDETTWSDLDITPETSYEYLMTTVSTSGFESEGVILSVSTPEEPLPVMEDETIVESEEDYVITWSSPTTGQIKVLIGGEEYVVVEASIGTITIPREDMEYTFFGEPDVELIPISEAGLEGTPTEPEGRDELGSLNLGFDVNDVLITGMKILAWIAPLLLLTLAIRFQKPIIELLRKAATYIRGTRKEG